MNQTNKLEDFKVNVKIKIAALWTSLMFCYIYEDYSIVEIIITSIIVWYAWKWPRKSQSNL
jgi:hypothetical protein